MKSEAATSVEKASPPSKKARTADFSTVIKRSHSVTENSILDIMTDSIEKFKEKVINDSIHGHIVIPAVAVAIIDTPQFQRLRFLKQVGGCHFVYPNATHTRFQHSLGVGYLARKFAKKLQEENPDKMDDKDVICVMIAGLCHDLGHGPFSHLWEGFVNKASPGLNWAHEDSSIRMLDYLIEDNNLMPVLAALGDINAQDILFIKECIAGPIDEKTGLPMKGLSKDDKTWRCRGRPIEKSFLYEIVANKRTGIDVDKWDYLKRDAYHMGIKGNFDHDHLMHYCKVIKVDNRLTICYRDKEDSSILDMYRDRARMHKVGYQHRGTKIVDRMMVDAWLLADQHIKVKGQDNKLYSLSKACQDVVAYERLTDDIFTRIKDSDEGHEDLIKASTIIRRIMKRDFYKTLATITADDGHQFQGKEIVDVEKEIRGFIAQQQNPEVKPEDILVLRSEATMGMGDRDPMHNVPFYNKQSEYVDFSDSTTICKRLSPDFLKETYYVICTKNEACGAAFKMMEMYLDNNNMNPKNIA